ncbi:hypothetical protein J4458_00665 [Candidatus Woesearchaeota archaeon]|nr:hypothetical protein [Candidatus Woesearchaeota archaeon]
MKKNELKKWECRFLVFGLLLVVIFGVGCVAKETQTPISKKSITTLPKEKIPQSGEQSPPITADLSMSGVPSLGQVVELTFSSKFDFNAKNVTMNIFLPEGFVLVNGNLTFNGEVSAGEKVQIKSLVKATETGMGVIQAKVINYYPLGGDFTNRDSLYINVSENSGEVRQLPFDYPDPTKRKERIFDYDIKLELTETPYLNNPVNLRVTVTPTSDSPDFVIGMLLPEGIVLPGGKVLPEGIVDEVDLIKKIEGPVAKGEKVQFDTTIKVVKEGYWEIKVGVGKQSYEQANYLYINASGSEITVSSLTPQQQQQKNYEIPIATTIDLPLNQGK